MYVYSYVGTHSRGEFPGVKNFKAPGKKKEKVTWTSAVTKFRKLKKIVRLFQDRNRSNFVNTHV